MPDPKPKLVQVNGIGVVSFPGAMDDSKIAAAIKSHKELSIRPSHEGKDAMLPPELERVEHEVGAEYVKGKPYGNAIATVGEHEPHKIEINDKTRWNQGPQQTRSHELIHILFNNLAGPIKEAIPADDPKHPYDISHIDELRKKGYKLWNLSQEQAATVVQLYTADPSQRKRLLPWIQDINNAPLSTMNLNSPNQNINLTPRTILPPPSAYATPAKVKEAAERLRKMTMR